MAGNEKVGPKLNYLVPGATLFTLAFCAACVMRPSLPDPLAAGWQGKPVCERLQEDEHHRILHCTFPPGVGHERHYHRPHLGYSLTGGRASITDASGTVELDHAAGSSSVSEGVDRHVVVNTDETTIQYLIVEPM